MKIVWIRKQGHRNKIYLRARCSYDYVEHTSITTGGLRDIDMDPVQDWCVANQCGTRMSFDTFLFDDEKELSMFLLRWA